MADRQRRDAHRSAIREATTFKEKMENFWYYYKFHVIFGAIIVAFLTISIADVFNKEQFDFSVVVATRTSVQTKAKDLLVEKIEQAAPANPDGSAPNVELVFVVIPEQGSGESADEYSSQVAQLRTYLKVGRAALYLFDSGVESDMELDYLFEDLQEQYPQAENLEGNSWYIKKSEFMNDDKFKSFPDDLRLHVRKLDQMEGDGKKEKIKKSHAQQKGTFENILNGVVLREAPQK